jgi:DNA-binding response OmpR family regulator
VLYCFEDFTLDTDRCELRRNGEPVAVEPQVFDLLVCLIRNRDRVLSKDDLLAAVWGGRIVSDATIDSRVTAARRALNDRGDEQRLIKTVLRKGVRFVATVREQEPAASPAAGAPATVQTPTDGMKILVVDDHALIRDALRGVLRELKSDAAILEAADSRQAMRLVAGTPDLDLVLLDLGLPDRDGFAVLAELRRQHPDIPIAVLSALNDRDNVLRALDLGALGFIPKSAQRQVMVSALNLIFAGGIYIPPDILDRGDATALKR